MEVLASNSFLRDVNIFHTVYYPTDVMLYLEQHHIFEIFYDLMILLDQKRPNDVYEFIANNISKLADKYRKINIVVECPQNSDVNKIAKLCGRVHDSPIISIDKPISKNRIKKLSLELKRFGLDKANLIFMGDRSRIPQNIIVKEFHLSKRIDLSSCDTIAHLSETRTILPIAVNLKNALKQLALHPDHQQVRYIERILMVGRPGSGKHRQARLLANHLDLILVSVNDLINTARCEKNLFKKALEIGLQDNAHTSELIATIVQKRLLQPDCLQFGWVLVDFPNTAEDVNNLFHLLMVPKKIIHLHTNARLCWKRKNNKIMKNTEPLEIDEIQWKESMLHAEFDFYDIHQLALEATLERQNCVILDINGNKRVEEVHEDILKKLLKI